MRRRREAARKDKRMLFTSIHDLDTPPARSLSSGATPGSAVLVA